MNEDFNKSIGKIDNKAPLSMDKIQERMTKRSMKNGILEPEFNHIDPVRNFAG